MRIVINDFKTLSKKIKMQDVKLSVNMGELTVKEIHLMPVNMFNAMPINRLKAKKQVIAKEIIYGFDGELFKTVMQQIEITVKNASEIKGKNVKFEYGILINDKFEYVDMGEYYIKDVEDDKNKEELVVTGYDNMLKFMIPFKQSDLRLTYPCKMRQLVQRMGEVCGVELYSTDFYNADLIIDEDFFTIQELTYRDVLDKVARATLTNIFIKEDKLNLSKIGNSIQTLDTSYLSNLIIGEKFGPVNALVLARGSVEDNIESINQESIELNGRHELRFDENEFLDSKREEVIDDMFNKIDGLEYYAFEASNIGLMWLEPFDVITAKDREENEYKTIYLKARVTINTGIKGEMEAEIPSTTTTEYKVTTKEQKKTLKVERLAKKNEGLIQDVIKEQTENSQKLTQVEQTVDSISQKVENIEDLTNTIEGIKTITLENCVAGDLLELHIYGNNTVFDYLYPSNDIYPSDDLYPFGDSRIVVNNTDVYELGVTEVLRQNEEVCDEFVLEQGQAKVVRRVNKGGTTKVRETIENLGEFKIKLKDGTNTIQIQNYTANMKARFAIKNDYTEVFATKVELSSSITQTAEEINMEVKKKVDENEVISKINQSAEAVGINANKIELSANDVLNLLAGNTINLSSKNITISSEKFNVDENGKMSCNDANIRGKIIVGGDREDPEFLATNGEFNTSIFPLGLLNEINGNYAAVMKGGLGVGTYTSTSMSETTTIDSAGIRTNNISQTSLEENKKNFEKLQKGLDIVNNTEIYKYNLKTQADKDKKHIGFVIGKNYKYSNEITALDNNGKEIGVDTYSMISVAYKAIQELFEKNQELQKEIEDLKKGGKCK